MQIISRRIPAGALLLVLIQLAGGAFAQPQSPEQQRCITALNAGFAKVAKARSKTVVRCAKAAQKGDAFAACLAEQQQKLDKALAKLASTESKKCSAAPDFGPGDVATLGDSAAQLADTALSDLLGLSLDAAIADKKQEKDTARCQLGVAKAAGKCALARVSAFNRCKKAGLKSGSIASAADLAACLDDDDGGRLAKACTAKLAKAATRCHAVDIAEAFPACGASDAASLTACADGRLACRAGEALADADAFTAPSCGLTITPEADEARTATGDIGPEGGQVEAIGADGTVYRLTVPEGALPYEQSISLTPVTQIPDLPLEGDLLAAVEFAPDGLQLLRGAVLEIELTSAPDLGTDVLVGIAWEGPGDSFHLVPAGTDGATLTLAVTHFSGVGVVAAGPALIAQLAPLVGAGGISFQTQLANLVAGLSQQSGDFVSILVAWYDSSVKPKLQAGPNDDAALQAALVDLISWLTAVETIPLVMEFVPEMFLGLDGFALATRIDEANGLVAAALRAGVERAHQGCADEQDLVYAEVALFWQAAGMTLGVATAENELDFETVLGELCVELLYDELTYPQSPPLGIPSQLHASVGHSFDGETILFTEDADIIVEAEGADPGGDLAIAFQGSYFENFAPTGETELALRIEACLLTPDHPTLSGKVCQTGLVVRGLEITPSTASLQTGEQVDFDALLLGAPHPSVSWSATGGSVDSNGVFTAGDTEGTFSVTAASNTTEGVSESATVTIGAGSGLAIQAVARESGLDAVIDVFGERLDEDHAESDVLVSDSLSVSAGGSTPDVGGGSCDASDSLTLDFDGAGNLVGIDHQASASSTGNGRVVIACQVALNVWFNVTTPVSYEFSVPQSTAGFAGHGVTLWAPDGSRFYRRSASTPFAPPDPVGDDVGVLPPGEYWLMIRASASLVIDQPSGSFDADTALTLTP